MNYYEIIKKEFLCFTGECDFTKKEQYVFNRICYILNQMEIKDFEKDVWVFIDNEIHSEKETYPLIETIEALKGKRYSWIKNGNKYSTVDFISQIKVVKTEKQFTIQVLIQKELLPYIYKFR